MSSTVDAARLAELTTLRVGGPAGRVVRATDEQTLIAAVADADAAGEPVLLVGGGSNLLVGDAGIAGTVVVIATRGLEAEVDSCSGAQLTLAAGEPWDDVVAHAVASGWVGLEALSGIPGLTGATPIQNVGAYGAEIADVLARVRTYDRERRVMRTFAAADCGFGYRDSLFKRTPGRYVVCSITLQLKRGELSAPIRYAELARALGVEAGERAPLGDVRAAVLGLRRGKGMVLDEHDHDTWSAGSFFTNPVLTAEQAAALPADAPRYPSGDMIKTSAAWLIEHAGFGRGYGTGPVGLSTRHTLAITNRGGARATDVIMLAREIRSGVQQAYGITLVPEPVLVGCEL